MNKVKILSILFFIVAVGLAFLLGNSIKTSIDEKDEISRVEEQIKRKLIMIRDGQIAYQAVNGQYTSDWGRLKSFIDTGRFYLTSKKEHIITLDYGADSVYVEIDTLGTMLVMDSVFSNDKYPDFDLSTMDVVPGVENAKFSMWADEIDKSGVTVDVIEVVNPKPFNKARKESNEARSKKPLRFGSRTSVTTAGNWE